MQLIYPLLTDIQDTAERGTVASNAANPAHHW